MSKIMEKAESPEHRRLVKQLIEWMENEGFKVECAAHPDYNRCSETEKGHIPDAKGYDRNRELRAYGEAKTTDDIDSERTKDQFRDFSKRMMTESKKSCPFFIVAPEGSEDAVRAVLKELGLSSSPFIYVRGF